MWHVFRRGHRMRGLLCGWLAAAPIAMSPVVARAQPAAPEKSNKQAAKAYVDAGLQAQRSGDYDTAIILYEKAYELVPHPVLLFNLAQAHRLAGRLHKALALYRKYLDTEPHGSEAVTARELVTELEAQQAADDKKPARARRADADPTPARATPEGHDDVRDEPRREPREDARGDSARATERAAAGSAGDAGPPAARVGDARAAAAVEERPGREAPDRADPAGAASRTQLRVALGTSLARRHLDYDLRSGLMDRPPPVATTGGAARFEGEIYPFALADPESALSELGLVAVYDKTFGLDLARAGGAGDKASVDQSHFALGVRYRFHLGEASMILVGIDYARRGYVLDRSGVGSSFDVPDVDCAAIAPTLAARLPVATHAAIFASFGGQLIFDVGSISNAASYGRVSAFGFDGALGLELALAPRLSLHLQIEYSEIDMTFDGTGVMSNGRDGDPLTQDVNGATDLSFGVAATLGLVY